MLICIALHADIIHPEQIIDTLVTTEWLSRHIDEPELVILDCSVYQEPVEHDGFRNVSGRGHYEKGHIPTAVFADLKEDLADASSSIEFALPTPEQFCSAMGALGVGDDTGVVLYDASYSAWAARVWWMLRWVGFDRAAILDGGLRAWTEEGRPLSTGAVSRPAKPLTPRPRPDLIADQDEVLACIDDESVRLIDTMPDEYYSGEKMLYDRPGHITGAENKSALNLLDETGRYRSVEELESLLEGNHDARTITYCGGGIMASSTAFIMARLGFRDVAVYTASLQEWAADPSNPMEVNKSVEERLIDS